MRETGSRRRDALLHTVAGSSASTASSPPRARQAHGAAAAVDPTEAELAEPAGNRLRRALKFYELGLRPGQPRVVSCAA